MSDRSYLSIVEYYESCLQAHSSGPRAVDWKSEEDARLRYDIMLELIKTRPAACTLLDFGCGLAALETHIRQRGGSGIRYTGLELSEKFAAAARAAHPGTEVLCMDVLASDAVLPLFDYIVMNGIFTRRHEVSVEDMDRYMRRMLSVVYRSCRIGLAFNVMSKAVDWESASLFHPDPGPLMAFIGSDVTRHFVLRNDYGLHETTYYLYRQPSGRRTDWPEIAP